MENMKTINGFVIYTIENMVKTYLTDFDSDDWSEEKTKSFIFESFEDAVGIVNVLSKSYPENIYGTEPFDRESFNEHCSQTVSTWFKA